MDATLTWKIRVTVLKGGKVTEPLALSPAMFKTPMLALPATLELTKVAPLRPRGRLSVKLALVAVLGPALVITKLKVIVLPAPGVKLPGVLTMPRLATGVTVRVAVTALELGPTEVVSEPAGIELGKEPPELLVTTTDNEQLDAGGIAAGADKLTEPAPAVATGTAEPAHVVATAVTVALTNPAG